MTSYGSNSAVQYLALKRTDSNLDNQTGAYRDVATSFINGKLNLTVDITSPSDGITRAANLLAAGLMMTSAQTIDEINGHPFIKLALQLLDSIAGDQASDNGLVWDNNFVVDRF